MKKNNKDKIDHIYEKIDRIHEEIHNVDKRTVKIHGELKILNGQVSQNKDDIKSIKSFIWKVVAGLGTLVSVVVTFTLNTWLK